MSDGSHLFITFRVRRSRRQGEMYIGHGRLYVCVSICPSPVVAFPHYCTDPDVTWRNGRECQYLFTIGGFASGARVSLL